MKKAIASLLIVTHLSGLSYLPFGSMAHADDKTKKQNPFLNLKKQVPKVDPKAKTKKGPPPAVKPVDSARIIDHLNDPTVSHLDDGVIESQIWDILISYNCANHIGTAPFEASCGQVFNHDELKKAKAEAEARAHNKDKQNKRQEVVPGITKEDPMNTEFLKQFKSQAPAALSGSGNKTFWRDKTAVLAKVIAERKNAGEAGWSKVMGGAQAFIAGVSSMDAETRNRIIALPTALFAEAPEFREAIIYLLQQIPQDHAQNYAADGHDRTRAWVFEVAKWGMVSLILWDARDVIENVKYLKDKGVKWVGTNFGSKEEAVGSLGRAFSGTLKLPGQLWQFSSKLFLKVPLGFQIVGGAIVRTGKFIVNMPSVLAESAEENALIAAMKKAQRRDIKADQYFKYGGKTLLVRKDDLVYLGSFEKARNYAIQQLRTLAAKDENIFEKTFQYMNREFTVSLLDRKKTESLGFQWARTRGIFALKKAAKEEFTALLKARNTVQSELNTAMKKGDQAAAATLDRRLQKLDQDLAATQTPHEGTFTYKGNKFSVTSKDKPNLLVQFGLSVWGNFLGHLKQLFAAGVTGTTVGYLYNMHLGQNSAEMSLNPADALFMAEQLAIGKLDYNVAGLADETESLFTQMFKKPSDQFKDTDEFDLIYLKTNEAKFNHRFNELEAATQDAINQWDVLFKYADPRFKEAVNLDKNLPAERQSVYDMYDFLAHDRNKSERLFDALKNTLPRLQKQISEFKLKNAQAKVISASLRPTEIPSELLIKQQPVSGSGEQGSIIGDELIYRALFRLKKMRGPLLALKGLTLAQVKDFVKKAHEAKKKLEEERARLAKGGAPKTETKPDTKAPVAPTQPAAGGGKPPSSSERPLVIPPPASNGATISILPAPPKDNTPSKKMDVPKVQVDPEKQSPPDFEEFYPKNPLWNPGLPTPGPNGNN